MRVAELGEFRLISKLADLVAARSDNRIPACADLLIGIGDDTAAWTSKPGIELITTDVLVEDIHFRLGHASWSDLGWKSIAINISDIYAMGGRPEYALVSLALPGSHDVINVIEMYRGMIDICNQYGIALIGGNISACEKIVINITLTGTALNRIMTRTAAKPGDLIAVIGYPGISAAALAALKMNVSLSQRALKLFNAAHLHPIPPLDSGPLLVACGVRAAIDISDGLLSDLGHICEASGVSATLYEQNLPVHPLLKRYFKQDYLKLVLTGGEDYKLLFTAGRSAIDKAAKCIKPAPTIIGEIASGKRGKITVRDRYGKQVKLDYRGWDHFRWAPAHG